MSSIQKKRRISLTPKTTEDPIEKLQKLKTEIQDAATPQEPQQMKNEKSVDDSQLGPFDKSINTISSLAINSDINKTNKNPLMLFTSNKQRQTKKFVVKGSIGIPEVPREYQQIYWQKLADATNAILSQTPIQYTLEELYSAVEGLLILKVEDKTYYDLINLLDSHLKIEHQHLLSKVNQSDHYHFLTELNKSWTKYCQQIKFIRSIFLPLDRCYALLFARPIWDVGMDLYSKNICGHSLIGKSTISGILYLIESNRRSEIVDQKLLHSLGHMLLTLDIYHSTFEGEFLNSTEIFYVNESKSNLLKHQDSIELYLNFVQKCLDDEYKSTITYLDPKSNKKLIPIVEKVLIIDHVDEILKLNFDFFVSQDRIQDLSLLYDLFNRVDHLKLLRDKWSNYIRNKGTELVRDPTKEKILIEILLKWKCQLDKVLENCFQKDNDFVYASKEALETALNSISYLPAELLANHLNKLLIKQTNDFEGKLDKVIQLFCLLNNKDIFEAFARKDLAKRMLYQRSSSLDAENLVVSKLKHECGPQYTAKMEEMFKDIELSKTLSEQFKEYLVEKNFTNKITPAVNVLTMGQWPTFSIVDVILPSEFSLLQNAFNEFHKQRFSGRHLLWVYTHGQATLKATFNTSKKELYLSFFQCWILLLFNSNLELSYTNIKDILGLKDDDELKRSISSLVHGKFKLMLKCSSNDQNGNDSSKNPISENDTFRLNLDFSCPSYRVKLNQIQLKDTKVEQVQTHEKVLQNRVYMVDAAIVRIMKARKTMKHAEFIAELMNILKFPVKVADLKKQIEIMIQRDFLCRDPNDSSIYHYVA